MSRVVVVTGAAGAIGAAVCSRLRARGDVVVGLDRSAGAGAASGEIVHCDISDETSVASAFDTVRDRHGDPTVLVNSAGVTGAGGVEQESPEDWRRILDVNLTGAYLCISKGGLVTLSRFLALHHAADNITVNAVAPGPHDTPMWHALDPAWRERILATVPGDAPGDPDDLAAVVEFLCGPHAGYITGATVDVNGGQWMG